MIRQSKDRGEGVSPLAVLILSLKCLSLVSVCLGREEAGFLEEKLPLKVVSLSPSTRESSNGKNAIQIYGRTSIVVVYNRAVIPLGSDYGEEELPAELTPFTLSVPIPGKQRWVTTYMFRFDPDSEWPTGLEFHLKWNEALTSYDGVQQVDPGQDPCFVTPQLEIMLGSVSSKTADNLTDGTWQASAYPVERGVLEFPPDGRLQLYFSAGVQLSLIQQALKITPAQGVHGHSLALTVHPCTSWGEDGSMTFSSNQAPSGTAAASSEVEGKVEGEEEEEEPEATCAEVAISSKGKRQLPATGVLEVDTVYKIRMEVGSNYSARAGLLRSPFSQSISGLRRFKVPLRYYPDAPPMYRRLDLWLRHGLEPEADIASCLHLWELLPESRRRAVAFQVSRPAAGLLRIAAPLQPFGRYALAIWGSVDVRDGYGLPLQNSTLRFTMAGPPSYIASSRDQYVLLEEGSGWGGRWPVFVQSPFPKEGRQEVFGEHQQASEVGAWSLAADDSFVKTFGYGHYPNMELGPPHAIARGEGKGGSYSTQHLNATWLLAASGIFGHRLLGGLFAQESLKPVGEASVALVLISGTNEVLAWVTRLDDAAPVAGAVVRLLSASELGKSVEGTTREDGTVRLSVAPANPLSSAVVKLADGRMVYVPTVPYVGYNPLPRYRAVLISDRGLYKAGDIVKVKGYVRESSGHQVKMPTGKEKMYLRMELGSNFVSGKDSPLPILVPVTLDRNFGTFAAELQLPQNADPGTVWISLDEGDVGWSFGDASSAATTSSSSFSSSATEDSLKGKLARSSEVAEVLPSVIAEAQLSEGSRASLIQPLRSGSADREWDRTGQRSLLSALARAEPAVMPAHVPLAAAEEVEVAPDGGWSAGSSGSSGITVSMGSSTEPGFSGSGSVAAAAGSIGSVGVSEPFAGRGGGGEPDSVEYEDYSNIAAVEIVVGEPRPPTATLQLTSAATFARPGTNVSFSVQVATYLDTPMSGASIALRWRLEVECSTWTGRERWRGASKPLAMADRGWAGGGLSSGRAGPLGSGSESGASSSAACSSASVSLSCLLGEATAVTDSKGGAVFDLNIDPELALRPGLGSLHMEAEFVGPTRELLQQSLALAVCSSPWRPALILTQVEPLPGVEFGAVPDLESNAVKPDAYFDASVSAGGLAEPGGADGVSSPPTFPTHVILLKNVTILEGTDQGQGRGEGTAWQLQEVQRCESTFGSGARGDMCRFVMPSVGHYVLRGCMQDENDVKVCAETPFGKTAEEWKQCPLTAWGSLRGFLDKPSYQVGDTATLRFDNPVAGAARALVRWGSKLKKEQRLEVLSSAGAQELQFPVGQECLGGCTVTLVVVHPREHGGKRTLAPGVIASRHLDVNAPFMTSLTAELRVTEPDRDITTHIEVDRPQASPGEEVTVQVQLSDPSSDGGGTPVSGEVFLVAIDKAVLDLVPRPLVRLSSSLAAASRFSPHGGAEWAEVESSHKHMVPPTFLSDLVSTFEHRKELEPWHTPRDPYLHYGNHRRMRWPENMLCFPSLLDVSDDDYLASFSSSLSPLYGSSGGREQAMNTGAMMRAASMATMDMAAKSAQPELMVKESFVGAAAAAAAGSPDSPGAAVRYRSGAVATPLFLGQVLADQSGRASVKFTLPGNVGTYVVRAYIATSTHKFGSAETLVVSARPLSLVPSLPRMVRVGDSFQAGVTVNLVRAGGGGGAKEEEEEEEALVGLEGREVRVDVKAAGGIRLAGSESLTAVIAGRGPHEVKFEFRADRMGEARLSFVASGAGLASDGLGVTVQVEATQEPVLVASSMAIAAHAQGSAASWTEALELPAVIPGSGSLQITAGVGRLPIVRTLSRMLLHRPPPWKGKPETDWLLASLVPAAALGRYGAEDPALKVAARILGHNEEAGLQEARAVAARSESLLGNLTMSCWGVVSQAPPFRPEFMEVYLNAFAVFTADQLELMGRPLSANLRRIAATWRLALGSEVRRTIRRAPDAWPVDRFETTTLMASDVSMARESYANGRPAPGNTPGVRPADDYDALAEALLALGAEGNHESMQACDEPSPSLGEAPLLPQLLEVLEARLGQLSVYGRAAVALAYLNAKERAARAEWPRMEAVVQRVASSLLGSMRVTGRTAYVAQAGGSRESAGRAANALALLVLIKLESESPLVEKLANHLAGGAGQFQQSSSMGMGSREAALSIVALTRYDVWKGSTAPNLRLDVAAGEVSVLSAPFRTAAAALAQSNSSWDALGSPPGPLHFEAVGSGEVSVAAELHFVPARVNAFPVYRGLYVERIIQRISVVCNLPAGPDLAWVEVGEMVMVTIQVTSPDDVNSVVVVDLPPGGLEPRDKNIFPLPPTSTSCAPSGVDFPSSAAMYWGGGPELYVLPEAVRMRFSELRAGTHTLSYAAVAATAGRFVLPPVKAFVSSQPEVMGLSAGGEFWIVEKGEAPQQAPRRKLLSAPRTCPAGCSGTGICNVATGECTCDAHFYGRDCAVYNASFVVHPAAHTRKQAAKHVNDGMPAVVSLLLPGLVALVLASAALHVICTHRAMAGAAGVPHKHRL